MCITLYQFCCKEYTMHNHITADGGDKSAHDLRAMAREERIRAGEDQKSVFGGFEKYTKVRYLDS